MTDAAPPVDDPSETHPDATQQLGLVGETAVCSYTNHLLDWIPLADPKVLPDPSVRLYWLLKSFIIDDKGRGDAHVVQIVQEDLADMLHRSVDSIQRAMKPLYKAGLVEDKERRKVSARVPGRDKPAVTTLLILQINDVVPPADYTGWRRPFEARKAVRAERAEAKTVPQEDPGQCDTANLRPQSDQGEPPEG
jgi:hypothetical protein